MAKKQTRRSISVSRGTYERLKAYCETNGISMSQFVERRVGDYLGRTGASAPAAPVPSAAPTVGAAPSAPAPAPSAKVELTPITTPKPAAAPVSTSALNQPISQPVAAASRPAPKPKSDEPLIKDPDTKLTADQIFTF